MRKGMWLATVVVAGILGQVSAVISDPDSDPAPFRGGENTTLQSWLFSTDANPSFPDEMVNNYGGAQVDLVLYDPQATLFWFPDDGGRQGVWQVDRSNMDMIAAVQNNPVKNATQDIWLQITYRSDEKGSAPQIFALLDDNTNLDFSLTLDKKNPLDPSDLAGYYHAVYKASLPYAPSVERIYIRPRDCLMLVDGITIETQSIPEPATLIVLGLGGLVLRRRAAGL